MICRMLLLSKTSVERSYVCSARRSNNIAVLSNPLHALSCSPKRRITFVCLFTRFFLKFIMVQTRALSDPLQLSFFTKNVVFDK